MWGRRGRRFTVLIGVAAGACRASAPPAIRPTDFPFRLDSVRSDVVQSGVTRRFLYAASGPWAIHVFDVDRRHCWSVVAAKSGSAAAGRATTSSILRDLAGRGVTVAGGVNADFFTTTGPLAGLPVGLFVTGRRVVAGPAVQPALAIDSTGLPRIGVFRVVGSAIVRGRTHALSQWNRDAGGGLALFDHAWGASTDTATSIVEVVLDGQTPHRVLAVDTAVAGVVIPSGGRVLRTGRGAPGALVADLVSLRPGDTVVTAIAIAPFAPREAVAGRPILLRDSQVVAGLDTVGQPGFATGRHPRTAAGIAGGGRRLILAVVDGRQAPYSDGMTLRETADLMRALGATDAINLDGGGSTALVYADPSGGFRVANRPSDPTGERAVGNALAIVRECPGQRR